jgi:hypothetical protein
VSNLSKDVLNVVKRKTGKSVSQKEIQKVASGIGPSTIKSEAQLRSLIKQVSKMAGVPVSESTMKELVNAIKKSGINPNQMESMIKSMLGK